MSSSQKFNCDQIPQRNLTNQQSKNNPMIVKKESFVLKSQCEFKLHYKLQRKLGEGSFGEVFKVTHKKLNQTRALKVIKKIKKPGFDSYDQLELLKRLDHPNILKIYEYYESDEKWFIVTEFFQGNELFDQIITQDKISQQKAALIIYEVLKPLVYIHSKNIAHRDIKAENIMIHKNEKGDYVVKLIDWGLGVLVGTEELARKCGTPQYCAPEVLKGKYTKSCDMWSLGVLIYIMLSGYMPFKGNDMIDTLRLVSIGRVVFKSDLWDTIQADAKHLIMGLLQKDPKKRLTAEEAIKHPWIIHHIDLARTKEKTKTAESLKETLERIKQFNVESKFHVVVINFIHNYLACPKQQEKLRKEFEMLDENKDGVLSFEQLLKGYQRIFDIYHAENMTAEIFKKLDLDASGQISYSEFITFATDSNKKYSTEHLREAFRIFDRDDDGLITKKQIHAIIQYKSGNCDEELQKVINELDFNSDGSIDFEQFIKCLNRSIQSSLRNSHKAYQQSQHNEVLSPNVKMRTSSNKLSQLQITPPSNQKHRGNESSLKSHSKCNSKEKDNNVPKKESVIIKSTDSISKNPQ